MTRLRRALAQLRARFRRKPARRALAPLTVLAMRNALATGSIVAGRTSPAYLADRRSLIAGTALLLTIAMVVLIIGVIGFGVMK